MKVPNFIAVDLGAESGRVMVGTLAADRVMLREINRFPNRPLLLPDGLHWDIVELYRQILEAARLSAAAGDVQALGIDTWGVDYGLLGKDGRLLGLPFHYRDRRTQDVPGKAARIIPPEVSYEITGIRPMPINTVYQLLSEKESGVFASADRLLLIPDLLTYWLCGQVVNERTAASTTGLLDARTGSWALEIIRLLGLPEHVFGDLVDPGTVVGPLLPVHQDAIGLKEEMLVVATAGHDTAAAFAGAPADAASGSAGAAILSSGTWSLLGVELERPVLDRAALAADLSNERGVLGTFRLLRNIMGLWLVQQCRAAWNRDGHHVTYEELTEEAAAVSGECPLFDPDDPSLAYPSDMPEQVRLLIRQGGQAAPQSRGALVRSILVSLACKYRFVLEQLEHVAGLRINRLYIVGGGTRNKLLCQLTADITQREVIAGPAEASALGNVLVQAYALGYISDREHIRHVAQASADLTRYAPSQQEASAEATYSRFLTVTGLGEQRVGGH